MHKKYTFPLTIFLFLNNTKMMLFSSKFLVPNHFFLFIDKNWIYTLTQILKKEFSFFNSTLLDISAIDTFKYNKNLKNIGSIFEKNRILVFFLYYFQFLKLRLTVVTFYKNVNSTKMLSIDNVFKNANWLERETSEMFGICYNQKNDIRKLLLDYSKNENPMLKDFPCEGYSDVFYNIFEEQVTFHTNDVIEL